MRFRESCLLLSMLALVLPAPVAWAVEDEEAERLTAPRLFPENTLAYVRINDITQLKEDLGKSSIGKLSNDDQLRPILSEFYGSLVQNVDVIEDRIGLNLDELLSIPSGEFAFALLPNDYGRMNVESRGEGNSRTVSARVDSPGFAVLLDAGKEIAGVQIMLDRFKEAAQNMTYETSQVGKLVVHRYRNPERSRQQFAYFIDDGVIVASNITTYLEKLAMIWTGELSGEKSLADNKKFTSIMSRSVGTSGERPQVSFFADPLAIVRQFAPQNTGTSMAMAMLAPLGLDGFEAMGGSWIVAPPDFDSISHFHISLKSPRRAVLSLLRPKSGSTTPESWIPDTVASYSTINWDLAATVQGIERLYNQFRGPEALDKEIFAQVNNELEIDFREDVLNNLEGRITIVQGFVRPIKINSGSNVYAIKLRNADAFKEKVISKVLDRIGKDTNVRKERFGKLRVNAIDVGGRRNLPDTIRSVTICQTIIDDYLVIADSEYMLRQIADCLNGSKETLSESLEYQLISDRISAQLQDRECSAISFARPEETLQLFYELARDPENKDRVKQFADNNPFFKSLYTAMDKHELPPFSVIAKYLAPGGGFLVDEETGLHYMSFSLRRE